jgi:Domain of unknown function (DUF6398)
VLAKLARKRPTPLVGGRRATWAAGVVYALGQANFLFDPARARRVTADQLSDAFGVAKATMSGKARLVRDLLRIDFFSPEFQRADVAAENPMIWMLEVNGLVVEAPSMSRSRTSASNSRWPASSSSPASAATTVATTAQPTRRRTPGGPPAERQLRLGRRHRRDTLASSHPWCAD